MRVVVVLVMVGVTVSASAWSPASGSSSASAPAPASPARLQAGAPPAAGPTATPNTVRLAPDAARPRASLEVVAWLAGGAWRGDGLGGITEEIWSAPSGGQMMGMFRSLTPAGADRHALAFYEFLTFVEQEGSLVLKLKHFNPDLTGWEEKDRFVTFRLARVAPDLVQFDGLTFRREGPDRMTIFLALRDRDGTVREETFRYSRQ